MANKFIDPAIYNHIITADKDDLTRMKGELESEIECGLLKGAKYAKELELINTRLQPSK